MFSKCLNKVINVEINLTCLNMILPLCLVCNLGAIRSRFIIGEFLVRCYSRCCFFIHVEKRPNYTKDTSYLLVRRAVLYGNSVSPALLFSLPSILLFIYFCHVLYYCTVGIKYH